MLQVKGIDAGGVFNFIRHKPPDSEHTKEKKLWQNRFKNGMCPHCGQKLYKVKCVVFRKKYVPLNIPGKVDNGVCIHPQCNPPSKTRPQRPRYEEDCSSSEHGWDDEDITMRTEVDSVLDAIQAHRSDMAKFYLDLQKRSTEERETAALMLEETLMQINRSMAELSSRQKIELLRVEKELGKEIETAQTALHSLLGRVGQVEQVTSSLRQQFVLFRQESERERAAFQAQVQALHASLGRIRSGSDHEKMQLRQEIDALANRLEGWQNENGSLREENTALRSRLESKLKESQTLASLVQDLKAQLGDGAGQAGRSRPPFSPVANHFVDFPKGRRFKCRQTLTEPSDAVLCCALIGSSGQLLASTSGGTLFIHKLASGSTRYLLHQQLKKHSNQINCIATAAQDKTVVTGSDDTTLIVWTQTCNEDYQYEETLHQHKDCVYTCAISDDGTVMVSGSKDGVVHVWQRSVQGGQFQVSQTLKDGHSMSIEGCAISGDGRLIATASADQRLNLFERQQDHRYKHKQILENHGDSILCCAFDESGKTLVSGGKDNKLIVWTLQEDTGYYACHQTLDKHSQWINSCVLCNGGKMLVSASDDNTLRVWTRESTTDGLFGIKQSLRKHENFVHCCAALPDGQVLVSGGNDHTLKVWDLQSV